MCRAVVRSDTHSIRLKALREYRKVEKALARFKEQLKRYHESDVPGFRQWMFATFKDILARQRETENALDDKRRFLLEIEYVKDAFNLSEVAAYKKVVWRRANPREAEEEDRRLEEAQRAQHEAAGYAMPPDDGDSDDPFASGGEDGFEPFGDEIPDEMREILNRVFEDVTGMRLPGAKGPPRMSRDEESSVKDLYRRIVRRLHPDHHGRMSNAQAELWHEAQDAYRRRDAHALRGVLTRCDDTASAIGKHSAVSLILRLTQQLKQAVRQAKRDAQKLKNDLAWDYTRKARDPRFVRSVGAELQEHVFVLEYELRQMTNRLENLERRANRPPAPQRRPKGAAARLSRSEDGFLF